MEHLAALAPTHATFLGVVFGGLFLVALLSLVALRSKFRWVAVPAVLAVIAWVVAITLLAEAA